MREWGTTIKYGCSGSGLVGMFQLSGLCSDMMDGTHALRLASVRLRVPFSESSEGGRDIVLDVVGRIGDAARQRTHSWRIIARV